MGQFILNEGAAPSTPAAGYVSVYAKTDGKLYGKDDAGVETVITHDAALYALLAGSASQTFSVAPATAATHAIAVSQLFGFRNKITNSNGLISQRGDVALTSTNVYGSDRWRIRIIGGTGISGNQGVIQTSLSGSDYSNKWYFGAKAASWTSGIFSASQLILSKDAVVLNNKIITVSAYIYQDTGSSITFLADVNGETAPDNAVEVVISTGFASVVVPSGIVTKLSGSVSIPDNAATNGIVVYIRASAANTITSKYILLTDVQVEEGSLATPCERRPYKFELSECRHVYRVQSYYIPATTAQNLGTIDMRVTPIITGGGAGFTSTGTTADQLIAYQTTGGTATLTLTSEP